MSVLQHWTHLGVHAGIWSPRGSFHWGSGPWRGKTAKKSTMISQWSAMISQWITWTNGKEKMLKVKWFWWFHFYEDIWYWNCGNLCRLCVCNERVKPSPCESKSDRRGVFQPAQVACQEEEANQAEKNGSNTALDRTHLNVPILSYPYHISVSLAFVGLCGEQDKEVIAVVGLILAFRWPVLDVGIAGRRWKQTDKEQRHKWQTGPSRINFFLRQRIELNAWIHHLWQDLSKENERLRKAQCNWK